MHAGTIEPSRLTAFKAMENDTYEQLGHQMNMQRMVVQSQYPDNHG